MAFITTLLRFIGFAAAGYTLNDIVDLFRSGSNLQSSVSGGVQGTVNALQDKNFLIKLAVIAAVLMLVTVFFFMTKTQRNKILKF